MNSNAFAAWSFKSRSSPSASLTSMQQYCRYPRCVGSSIGPVPVCIKTYDLKQTSVKASCRLKRSSADWNTLVHIKMASSGPEASAPLMQENQKGALLSSGNMKESGIARKDIALKMSLPEQCVWCPCFVIQLGGKTQLLCCQAKALAWSHACE